MTTTLASTIPHTLSAKIRHPVLTFQYADDTLLIVAAKGNTLRKLLLTIHCFSAASGLMVNFAKSSFVPLSVPPHFLTNLESLLGCKRQDLPITYLGLPLSIKAPRKEDFMPILHKLESRLEGWKARFLSRAGKLQLVKSVLSSIPTYYMSCFSLPKWLINRIDMIRRQFFWSRIQNERPIHLLNWGTVCLPIRNGGLGVPNLHLQNMALLLRWWWRLYEPHRKLWSTYISLIYARKQITTGPLVLSSYGSFFWHSMLKLKPIFHSSILHCINLGEQTSFWYDAWAGQPLALGISGPIRRRAISVQQAKEIFHRLIPGPLTVQQNLAHEKIRTLLFTANPDTVSWRLSPSGNFSVRTIYKILAQGGKTISRSCSIWRAKVMPSMALFFYFLINNRLLTQDILLRRKLSHAPTGCVFCLQYPIEDAMHLFFRCPFTLDIWHGLSNTAGFSVLVAQESPLQTFLASIPRAKDHRKSWIVTFITSTSLIWRERNNRIFRNKSMPPPILLDRIQHEIALCLAYC